MSHQPDRTFHQRSSLREIDHAVNGHLNRAMLLNAIDHAVRGAVPCDGVLLTLRELKGPAIRTVALGGGAADTGGEDSTFDADPAHWVLQNGRPLLRGDLTRGVEFPGEEAMLAREIRSYVSAPLRTSEEPFGVLTVTSRTAGQLGESEMAFLVEVCRHISRTIENLQAAEQLGRLKSRSSRESTRRIEELPAEQIFEDMVGISSSFLALRERIRKVAPTDATVLLSGESGTGKELVARALHNRSSRKDKPLVKINCAAISAGLVESELFGHIKGAFTGATERRVGRFEFADGGTLFLDEVGELPLDTQVKLLRVLQEHEFEPVGSNRTVQVNVRVIAATNRPLEEAIRKGTFRADLFFRLNVVPIELPPLRERRSDIPSLVSHILSNYNRQFERKIQAVAEETLMRLMNHDWPGNVRELQNVLARAAVLSVGPVLRFDANFLKRSNPPAEAMALALEAAPSTTPPPAPTPPKRLKMEDVERQHIIEMLTQTHWVVEGPHGAAQLLGLHPNTLRSRMKKLHIQRPRPTLS